MAILSSETSINGNVFNLALKLGKIEMEDGRVVNIYKVEQNRTLHNPRSTPHIETWSKQSPVILF